MTMWSIDIETAPGVATATDQLEQLALALDSHAHTKGAAASLSSRSGVVSATFSVTATDAAGATEVGVAAFRRALADSRLVSDEPARVSVEQLVVDDAIPA
jgi:hypothetical protein